MRQKKSRTRDQYTIVLEDIRSQFGAFGDGLDVVSRGVKEINEKADKANHRSLKLELEIREVESQLANIQVDLETVKTELGLIRHNLITREELKFLETRILRLEKKVY